MLCYLLFKCTATPGDLVATTFLFANGSQDGATLELHFYKFTLVRMAPMSEEDLLLGVAMRSYLKKKRKRRFEVHPLNSVRLKHGQFHTIMTLLRDDGDNFFSYFRMSIPTFDKLLTYIKDDIVKIDTRFRIRIAPEERLAVTLKRKNNNM
uniref:Uncharacterized protein n=1 Tax=Cuerna arida TaxID=1464854 RepID=A0A1B6F9V5_9HEMI